MRGSFLLLNVYAERFNDLPVHTPSLELKQVKAIYSSLLKTICYKKEVLFC